MSSNIEQQLPEEAKNPSLPEMYPLVSVQMEDGREALLYELQPKQKKAWEKTPLAQEPEDLEAGNYHKHIGYGGAAGGAKSHLARATAVHACLKWPGINALIIRRTKDEVKKNHIKPFWQEVPKDGLPDGTQLYDWNGQELCATFRNGSSLYFGYMKEEGDELQYQGNEFDVIVFEEATHYTFEQVRYLTGERMRATQPYSFPFALYPSNPGNQGHCVPHGQVLTPRGWTPIEQMEVGDAVYTVDDDGQMVESRVEQTHREHYDGELVQVRARGFAMTCTPNHRVAKVGGTRERPGRHHTLVPFEDLPGQATVLRSVSWQGEPIGTIRPSAVGRERRPHDSYPDQPDELEGEAYTALLGWFLAEGYTIDRDRAFGIAQAPGETRDRLRELLEDICGFSPYWHEHGATIYARNWWRHFRKFGGCRDKYIPQHVKRASQDELAALFEALMAGDGHWQSEDGGTYYTTSERLAADVEEVALKLGYQIYTSQRQRENRDHVTYQVHIHRTVSGGTELLTGHHRYDVDTETERASDIQRVPYRGPVYCIGVPDTHSFVIKQDGAVWVSGNSWYKRLFIDGNFDPELNEDPDDYAFVQSYVWDNQVLLLRDPEYIEKKLLTLPEPLRSWRLWGDWDAGEGLALTMLDKPVHIVDQFKVPTHWPMWGGFDWGYAHPWAFGLYAASEDRRVYKVFSISGRRMLPKEIARAIKSKIIEAGYGRVLRSNYYSAFDTGRLNKQGFISSGRLIIHAGHDCWNQVRARGEDTPTIAEQFNDHDLILTRANVDRIQGLNNLRHHLAWESRGPEGQDIEPYLLFMDEPGNRACFKQLSSIPSDPDRPEDALKQDADEYGHGGDDYYDETRYALASRPTPAPTEWIESDIEPWSEDTIQQEAERKRKGNLPRSMQKGRDSRPVHPEFGSAY